MRGQRRNRPRLPLRQELFPLACILIAGALFATLLSESFPPTWLNLIIAEVFILIAYVAHNVREGRRYSHKAKEAEAERKI